MSLLTVAVVTIIQSSVLTWLQKSDPIFNMGIDVMRSVFNWEPKYRVTMLTRDEWTRRPGTPPRVKGSSGLQMGPELRRETGLGYMGNQ